MVGQLLLGLSILVGVHEWGHLIAAKIFGMKVEKYSIGFPPKIWGKRFGETEYSIGAIPLGGFVKIAGMIDESLDTKSLSAKPEPWEFRAKPAWQRLVVMMGGILVNLALGIIIFIVLAFVNGETYLTKEELNKNGIVAYDLGKQLGFQTGDRVLAINGKDFERFSDIMSPKLLLENDGYYTVERDGQEVRINLPNDFIGKITNRQSRESVISPRRPFSIASIVQKSNAALAGLEPGDRIIEMDGEMINYYDELTAFLATKKGEKVNLLIERSGAKKELTTQVTNEGTIGFYPQIELNFTKRDFKFFEAIGTGTSEGFLFLWLNIKGFKKIFSGDIDFRKSVMGPIGIMKQFGGDWNWNRFWSLVAMLSMILAFMNFLPIPALDGGHVMFLTWEIISGREPSDRFLENAQKFGMIILLSLTVFFIANDIINF